MAIFDVIKWEASPRVFAWKFPSNELTTASQLVVAPSQEAVLVNQGIFEGPFTAGRHTLSTQNYPFLKSLVKLPFGGKTPFTAEVWFVQKAFSLDIKWGTSDPIQIQDPKYKIFIPVRAFGQYSVQIQDSIKFLEKMVGTVPVFVEKTLQSYFKGILLKNVKDLLAKYFIEKNISILEISAKIKEISDALMSEISKEFEEYGFSIVNFNVSSISTDDKDPAVARLRRALAEKAEMEILGFNYQQKRTFDTMEKAASNEGAGGVINAGIGMGMGVGMGVPMGNITGQMAQNLNPTNTPSKFCQNCGNAIDSTVKFCPSCGTKI